MTQATPAAGPCTRPIHPTDMVGGACPACGHTNLVHPGHPNPALTCCSICEIQQAIPKESP